MKRKSGDSSIDHVATKLLHQIWLNDGAPRDREMLVTAFVIAYETLSNVLLIEQMTKENGHSALIKKRLALISKVLDGSIAIKDGRTIKLKKGPPR